MADEQLARYSRPTRAGGRNPGPGGEMSVLLCVDPGLRGCGCAVFADGALVRAAYVPSPEQSARGPVAWLAMSEAVTVWYGQLVRFPSELLLEVMRIYPRSDQQKGDPNDLLELNGVQGAIAANIKPERLLGYFPHDWKGSIPKDKLAKRIRLALTETERNNIISVGAKDHNTIDAIGIGLHRLGRLNRRVIAR
jgi:hypothetical protein